MRFSTIFCPLQGGIFVIWHFCKKPLDCSGSGTMVFLNFNTVHPIFRVFGGMIHETPVWYRMTRICLPHGVYGVPGPPRAPRAPTHPLKHSGTDRTRPDHQTTKSWDVSRFEGKSGTKSGTEIPKMALRIWDRRMNVCYARSPSSGKLFHFCKKIL